MTTAHVMLHVTEQRQYSCILLVHTLAKCCFTAAIADNSNVLSTFFCLLDFISSSICSRFANSSSYMQQTHGQ